MNDKTVQWFNATCAILTRHNAGNIRAFGGGLKLAGKEENGEEMDKATRDQNRQMKKGQLEHYRPGVCGCGA